MALDDGEMAQVLIAALKVINAQRRDIGAGGEIAESQRQRAYQQAMGERAPFDAVNDVVWGTDAPSVCRIGQ